MVGPAFRIILSIGNPCKGEVVAVRTSGTVPIGRLGTLHRCLNLFALKVGIVICTALHQQDGISVFHMILGAKGCVNISIVIRASQQLPLIVR
ncbi:hypothetical protein D3C73_1043050 [compost metagenome]